jgi:putative ABC transport system permease protein
MTWPFENDTSAITKKIAKNDIDKNRVKKVFSLTTIVFATALLMMLIMFESGYETTKDRMAEGQPQVVFYDLSQQQIELLYSEENIESIKVTETENGYDASITIVDATKMTQYGFSSAVDNISSKYDIHHVTRNDLFIDSLPNGGLLNQKNMVLMGVAIFIIIVSALVIYNVFYLSVVNQVRQFGQLRTVGMTQQQTKKIIRYERKILCRIGVPIGLLIGGLAGYLLQPDGWDWIAAVFWGIIISLIINFVVKVSLTNTVGACLGFFIYQLLSKLVSKELCRKFQSYNINEGTELLFFIIYSFVIMVTIQPIIISTLFHLA